jgi:hypothetical protein
MKRAIFRDDFNYWIRGIGIIVCIMGLAIFMRVRAETQSVYPLPTSGLLPHQAAAWPAMVPILGLCAFFGGGLLTVLTFGDTFAWFDDDRKRWRWSRIAAAAFWTALISFVLIGVKMYKG